MYYSLKGKIIHKDKQFIVIDVNGVGYQVIVSHPDEFILNEETFVYTYLVVREDEQYLVGFNNLLEKRAEKISALFMLF